MDKGRSILIDWKSIKKLQELRRRIIEALVLVLSKFDQVFEAYYDASNIKISIILNLEYFLF